jgi:3-methyladenine DNA glycosylase Tag
MEDKKQYAAGVYLAIYKNYQYLVLGCSSFAMTKKLFEFLILETFQVGLS